ncbi:MAG: CxxC-x17-CxxC domain-containing protein [Patescibacteria group bacterium]|jgi:CxxC-x17-CxxC domain-containing protein
MFNKRFGNKGGGDWKAKKSFGKDFGDRDSAPREMHEATCSGCNKQCEVPFKPNGRKPVFCSDCFRKDENQDDRASFGEKRSFRDDRGSDRGADRSFDRPAPHPNDRSTDRGSSEICAELRIMNTKLDSILKALTNGGE